MAVCNTIDASEGIQMRSKRGTDCTGNGHGREVKEIDKREKLVTEILTQRT